MQTVLPTRWPEGDDSNLSHGLVYSHFKNENYDKAQEFGQLIDVGSDILFISEHPDTQSDQALLAEEKYKWTKVNIYDSVRKQHRFIVNWLYDLLDSLEMDLSNTSDSLTDSTPSSTLMITRQFGQQAISSKTRPADHSKSKSRHDTNIKKDEEVFMDLKKLAQNKLQTQEGPPQQSKYGTIPTPSTSKKGGGLAFESVLSLTPEMQKSIEARSRKAKAKSPGKPKLTVNDAAMQTETKKPTTNPKKNQKVTIADTKDTEETRDTTEDTEPEITPDTKKDVNTQTNPKEKQD